MIDSLRRRLRTVVAGEVTQSEVARRAGVNRATITRFLAGAGMAPDTAERLSKVLSGLQARDINPLPPEHVAALAERLRNNKLVAFVGAGISHLCERAGSEDRLPLWRTLAQRVAARFEFDEVDVFDDPLDLFDAIALEKGRDELEAVVSQELPDQEFNLHPVHERLARLPFAAIVTTNYDRLLERAMPERKPVVFDKDHSRLDRRLVKIHGSLGIERGLHTLTRSDYRNWKECNPKAHEFFQQQLLDYTVLFLGYSLRDPHFDALLERRSEAATHRPTSYAWVWQPHDKEVRLRQRRDHLEVAGVHDEGQWLLALDQLERALEDPPLVSVGSGLARPQLDLWRSYAKAMDLRYGPANLEGLYHGRGLPRGRVHLRDHFVEPEVWRVDSQSHEGEALDSHARVDVQEEGGSVAGKMPDSPEGPQNDIPEETVDHDTRVRFAVRSVLSQHERVVLLGDPGSGKSTLAQYYCLKEIGKTTAWFEEHGAGSVQRIKPVFLRLAQWEVDGASPDLREYLRKHWIAGTNVDEQTVAGWCNGPIYWFLDGIDEVRSARARAVLQEILSNEAKRAGNDRWVVTSRPRGYYRSSLPGWSEFELAELSAQGTQALLRNWESILWEHSTTRLPSDQVFRDLQANTGMRGVMGNPMLVTMVVLFFSNVRRLPQHRWEFYRHAARVLNDSWQRARSLDVIATKEERPSLEGLLSFLAIKGMREGRTTYSEWDIERLVTEYCFDHGDGPERAESLRDDFLANACGLIGVIVEKAPNTFGFLHLSFQEFYAALWLVHRTGEAELEIAARWDHPHWYEVWSMLFLARKADVEFHQRMFAAIQRAPLEPELNELERTLLMKDRFQLEMVGLGPQEMSDSEEESLLPDSILRVADQGEIRQELALHSCSRWEHPHKSLKPAMLELLRSGGWAVQRSATRALASQAGQDDVRSALLELLRGWDPNVHAAAAHALSAEAGRSDVQSALLERLREGSWPARKAAALALASRADLEEVRSTLLKSLSDPDWSVQHVIGQALSYEAGQEEVRRALIEQFRDRSSGIQLAAAQALSSQAWREDVRSALLEGLRDSDWTVRRAAAHALASQSSYEEVRILLLKQLQDSDSIVRQAGVRVAAIEALASQAGRVEVRRALLRQLRSWDPSLSAAAAQALSSQADQEEIRQALISCMAGESWGERAWRARYAVANALASQASFEEVREVLTLSLSDPDWRVSQAAAEALASQVGHDEVRNALLSHLNDRDGGAQAAAAMALASQAAVQEVREALLRKLRDRDWSVCQAAAKALASQADRSDVRTALLGQLKGGVWNMQRSAAQSLVSQVGQGEVRHALLALLGSEVRKVRHASYDALRGHLVAARHGVSMASRLR